MKWIVLKSQSVDAFGRGKHLAVRLFEYEYAVGAIDYFWFVLDVISHSWISGCF
jgi:hypothetical protein